MKRLIITFFVFVPVLINAQTFWSVVDDDKYHNISHVTDKGFLQDSIILAGGFISDASCPYHNLFAYHIQGNKLWEIYSVCDVIKTDSNFIYTAGYDIGTDDVGGDEYLVIAKYNNVGNEIFKIKFRSADCCDYYFEFQPKNIDLATDGTILISSNNSIVKSNISGTDIKEYNVVLESQINAIHSINPISNLINTQNKIYKTDSSLILVDSIEFTNTINKLFVKNDTVFTLFDSYLIRIDTRLDIIDTILTSSVDLNNMEYYGDDLWIQLASTDSLRLINLQKFENPDTLVFPVLMNNAEFIVSGNSFSFVGNTFSNQIGICNFQIDNAEVEKVSLPDIELVDFDIDSIAIEYYQFQEDSFAIGYRFNTKLTIKNNGNDTLNSFAVFSDLHGGMNCAQNYFYQKFSDIKFLPGQTQTVNLKRAYEEGINNNQLCFKCLAPNSELEIQTSNNLLCKTFTLTGNRNKAQSNFKVYPNPITDYLILEQPDIGLKNVEIVDITGKVLIKRVSSEQRIRIETSNLKKGLYIVRINFGDKINTQLIIKE